MGFLDYSPPSLGHYLGTSDREIPYVIYLYIYCGKLGLAFLICGHFCFLYISMKDLVIYIYMNCESWMGRDKYVYPIPAY